MNWRKAGWLLMSGWIAIAASNLAIAAESQTNLNSRSPAVQLAQASLGCRRINTLTGVYEQPDTTSASRGILPRDQLVRLETRGEGWARINAPVVGWVQARYLTPEVACEGLAAVEPPRATPSTTPTPAIVCQVVPANGLIVRSEPVIADRTYRNTIPNGEHAFRFTGQRQRAQTEQGTRIWLYITQPFEGWISPGFEGEASNLTGDRCG